MRGNPHGIFFPKQNSRTIAHPGFVTASTRQSLASAGEAVGVWRTTQLVRYRIGKARQPLPNSNPLTTSIDTRRAHRGQELARIVPRQRLRIARLQLLHLRRRALLAEIKYGHRRLALSRRGEPEAILREDKGLDGGPEREGCGLFTSTRVEDLDVSGLRAGSKQMAVGMERAGGKS